MSNRRAELRAELRTKSRCTYANELHAYYHQLRIQYEENPMLFSQEEVTPEVLNIRTMIENSRRRPTYNVLRVVADELPSNLDNVVAVQ